MAVRSTKAEPEAPAEEVTIVPDETSDAGTPEETLDPGTPDDGTRTVKIGAIAYTAASGLPSVGTLGQVVQVHPDDLDRFDRLNAPVPPPEPQQLDADLLLELAARAGEASPEAEAEPAPDTGGRFA